MPKKQTFQYAETKELADVKAFTSKLIQMISIVMNYDTKI